MIEGLSVPDMMVKLKHNSKLVSPGYDFSHLNVLHAYICIANYDDASKFKPMLLCTYIKTIA